MICLIFVFIQDSLGVKRMSGSVFFRHSLMFYQHDHVKGLFLQQQLLFGVVNSAIVGEYCSLRFFDSMFLENGSLILFFQ